MLKIYALDPSQIRSKSFCLKCSLSSDQHELLMKVAGMRLKVIFLPAGMGNELVPSPLLAESSFISETHLRVRKYACAYNLAQQLQ